jgi:epoxyqueuosine reductase
VDPNALAADIKRWGQELGFQQIAITDLELDVYRDRYERFLAEGRHGEMDYLERHAVARFEPAHLLPNACRAIVARMDYLPPDTQPLEVLAQPQLAYVSRYALGRDYHKVVRGRLATLARRINRAAGSARGWVGKHTLVLNRNAGSWFFIGEIYCDLPLPPDTPNNEDHCGRCSACMTVCPTAAITGPRELDARRCISYLTIEHRGSIDAELRPLIGNRIFGCDDCQLVCPWNRYARPSAEGDFRPRQGLDSTPLLTLFAWSEATFLERTAGSALRRLSFRQWRRNLAVALGNGPYDAAVVTALTDARDSADPLVAEHIDWALAALEQRRLTEA